MGLIALLMTPPPASRAPPQRSWGGETDDQHLPSRTQPEHRPDPGRPDRRARASAGDRQREGRLGQVDDGAAHRRRVAGRGRARWPRSTSMRARARSAATSRTAPPMPDAKTSSCDAGACRGAAVDPAGPRGRRSRRTGALRSGAGGGDRRRRFRDRRHAGQRYLPVAARPHLGRHAADAAQRQLHRSRPSGQGRSRYAQDRPPLDLCRGGVEAAPAARRAGRPAGRLGGDAQSPVVAGGAQQARHGHGPLGAGQTHRLSHGRGLERTRDLQGAVPERPHLARSQARQRWAVADAEPRRGAPGSARPRGRAQSAATRCGRAIGRARDIVSHADPQAAG